MSPATQDEALKAEVRDYWNAGPCGSTDSTADPGTPEFFADVERRRYELEPFIPDFARWDKLSGVKMLEIGVGLGTDFVQAVRAGANATGVDLTERGVDLVRGRLAIEGLSANLQVADAESLPFADGEFERVYSWGVLHHTPDTHKAVREALRVLKPGGTFCIMMYSRHSWLSYGVWVRWGLLRGRPFNSLTTMLANHMESQGTKAFTKREFREMFDGMSDLTIEKVGTVHDRTVAGPLVKPTGHQLGWFTVIRGTKPLR